eukprot:3124153-Amphidinium_carterae.3
MPVHFKFMMLTCPLQTIVCLPWHYYWRKVLRQPSVMSALLKSRVTASTPEDRKILTHAI